MAFTVTRVKDSSAWKRRVVHLRVTPDSAEGAVATGLGKLDNIIQSKVGGTASLTCAVMLLNVGTTGTAANGTIGMSNVVSGGIYNIVAFGSA